MKASAFVHSAALAGAAILWLCAAGLARGQEDPAGLPVLAASDTAALMGMEGRKILAWGLAEGSGKSDSGANFIRFGDAEFYLVAFKSDLEPFAEGEPVDLFEGKRLAVTGVLSIYRGKPQIKLVDPGQVRVLAEGEEWPRPPAQTTVAAREDAPGEVAPAEPEAPGEAAEPRRPPVDYRLYFKPRPGPN